MHSKRINISEIHSMIVLCNKTNNVLLFIIYIKLTNLFSRARIGRSMPTKNSKNHRTAVMVIKIKLFINSDKQN